MARPKAFSEAEALTAAMAVFWAKGYEATSTTDLVEGMGIGRQSLYDTFGDKHALYLKALEAYQQAGVQWFRNSVEAAADPIAGIISILRSFVTASTAERHKGCMMLNAVAERCPHDAGVMAITAAGMQGHQRTFEAALARAQAAGAIPAGRDLRAKAQLALVAFYGMAVIGKTGRDSAVLEDALAALESALRQ
jgi:TetR/AcrR family transcriptional repressor of nem operon